MWERGLKPTITRNMTFAMRSLPVWERGLKQKSAVTYRKELLSLPVWERGLKLQAIAEAPEATSRSPCGSVD